MDVTTSKLITLCYALLALVACTAGYFFLRAQLAKWEPPDVAVAASQPSRRRVSSGSDAISRRLQVEVLRQRQRIDELQTLLRKRQSLVELQESQLRHRDDRNEKLQAEADDYLDLLFEVIQSSALQVDNLVGMKDASDQGESVGADTDSLRVALEASQWELEQSLASVEESTAVAAAAQARLTLLQQAIVDLGDVTVPTLIGLLGDQDAEIRVWSATTLGRLGTDGLAALDALNAAKDDADPSVREAATAALEELSASW